MSATRPSRVLDSAPARVTLLLLLAVIVCAHGFRPDRVLAPTDHLAQWAPWREAPAGERVRPANPLLHDQATQFVPWMTFTLERLRRAELPLWNPYSQLGVPFVGNGQSAVFHPTTLLHLALPPSWSWTLAAVLRLFAAGAGAMLLAGFFGASPAARLLAGATFMLCGFNLVWLNHPHMNTIPLLPWCVLASLRLVRSPSALGVAGAGALFGLQFLGGHPGSSIHLLLLCGLFTAGSAWIEGSVKLLRAAPWLCAAGALGIAVGLVQWWPLLEYVANSGAAVRRSADLGFALHFRPHYLVGLLFPYANGYPPDGITPAEIQFATGLPNTSELAGGFVGVLPLILCGFALALRRERRVALLAGVGGVSLLIATRFPVVDQIVSTIPGLGVTQNARLLVGWSLAGSILGAIGLDVVMQRPAAGVLMRKLCARVGALAAAGALAGAGGLWLLGDAILERGKRQVESRYLADEGPAGHAHPLEYHYETVERIHQALLASALRGLVPAAVLGLAAVALRRSRSELLIAVAASELLVFGLPYNSGAPLATYFPPNPFVEQLRPDPGAPYRVAGTFHTLRVDVNVAYRLEDVRGYDAVTPLRYQAWLDRLVPGQERGDSTQLFDTSSPELALLNLRYLVTPTGEPAPAGSWTRSDRSAKGVAIYESPNALPRAWVAPRAEHYASRADALDRVHGFDFDPRALVILDAEFAGAPEEPELRAGPRPTRDRDVPRIRYEPRSPERVRVHVEGANGGWLVVADGFFPGWHATLDAGGETHPATIWPAYGILRAVRLSAAAGPQVVEFVYAPASSAAGRRAAALGLLGLAGVAIVGWLRRPRTPSAIRAASASRQQGERHPAALADHQTAELELE